MSKQITKRQLKKLILDSALLATSFYSGEIPSDSSDKALYTTFDFLHQYGLHHTLDNQTKNNIIEALWLYSSVAVTTTVNVIDSEDDIKKALTYALKAVSIKPDYVWKQLHKALSYKDDDKQNQVINLTIKNVMTNNY